ncbi:hypothetical protein Aab01nite_80980 [Paractinoplanes abujensis]|uniref:Uncharacterized protein n=1 Tax=Paractinoplanes abujensis TaxID=882441 RepID=A0A7W7G221_9ACTN|nr:hypothetical protein [Actinoplanes abujensis]MBB4693307.1 hypothetical protein [Actinoplanes abujensis]GID24508.1 hypothetical protein Aab01nite_80980 [Actinoplanes abujensis]
MRVPSASMTGWDVPRGQGAGVADVVAVFEDAVQNHRDGFQAAVRVPLEAGRREQVVDENEKRVGQFR